MQRTETEGALVDPSNLASFVVSAEIPMNRAVEGLHSPFVPITSPLDRGRLVTLTVPSVTDPKRSAFFRSIPQLKNQKKLAIAAVPLRKKAHLLPSC
jgi:hypothetical protein